MKYVIATNRTWYEDLATRLSVSTGKEFILINCREELTVERLQAIQPRYIFFPHWSYLVPNEVHEKFERVIFHMTDVPFGRGGTPLQNLIARGIYETKISAMKCMAEVDAGPVYLKKPFALYGGAEEIYLRAARVIEEMIVEIVDTEPLPQAQQGEVVCFERRKPAQGDISKLSDLSAVFDYIRMLDAEGYPNAFLETDHFRLEFQRPTLRQGNIMADVIITKKE